MDYLEFIARVTSHIPDKGQVMIRYYGLYSTPTGERRATPEPMPFICQSLKMRTDMCPPKAGPR